MGNQIGYIGTGAYAGKKWDGRAWVAATPAEIAAANPNAQPPDPAKVPVSTLDGIAGEVLVRHVGAVATSQVLDASTADAFHHQMDVGDVMIRKGVLELQKQALAAGATAVVGVRFQVLAGPPDANSGAASGVRLLMMGTAVVTGPRVSQPAPARGGGTAFGVGVGIPLDFG